MCQQAGRLSMKQGGSLSTGWIWDPVWYPIFLTFGPVDDLTSPADMEHKLLMAGLLLFLTIAMYLMNLKEMFSS